MRLTTTGLLVAGALALAGCQTASTTSSAGPGLAANASFGYPSGVSPELSCSRFGTSGRNEDLTAQRVRAGDPAYIEFRGRMSPAIPSGHMYVVFGELDAAGQPASKNYIGLVPEGMVAGLYVGALVPLPGVVEPSYLDCTMGAFDAYRVSLTAEQYQALLVQVEAFRRSPPKWSMFGYNCNNFAATLGKVAGLREPANPKQPTFSYVRAYIRANGDGGQIKPARTQAGV